MGDHRIVEHDEWLVLERRPISPAMQTVRFSLVPGAVHESGELQLWYDHQGVAALGVQLTDYGYGAEAFYKARRELEELVLLQWRVVASRPEETDTVFTLRPAGQGRWVVAEYPGVGFPAACRGVLPSTWTAAKMAAAKLAGEERVVDLAFWTFEAWVQRYGDTMPIHAFQLAFAEVLRSQRELLSLFRAMGIPVTLRQVDGNVARAMMVAIGLSPRRPADWAAVTHRQPVLEVPCIRWSATWPATMGSLYAELSVHSARPGLDEQALADYVLAAVYEGEGKNRRQVGQGILWFPYLLSGGQRRGIDLLREALVNQGVREHRITVRPGLYPVYLTEDSLGLAPPPPGADIMIVR